MPLSCFNSLHWMGNPDANENSLPNGDRHLSQHEVRRRSNKKTVIVRSCYRNCGFELLTRPCRSAEASPCQICAPLKGQPPYSACPLLGQRRRDSEGQNSFEISLSRMYNVFPSSPGTYSRHSRLATEKTRTSYRERRRKILSLDRDISFVHSLSAAAIAEILSQRKRLFRRRGELASMSLKIAATENSRELGLTHWNK
jgi:hypothetical protein